MCHDARLVAVPPKNPYLVGICWPNIPGDIGRVEYGQSLVILQIGHAHIFSQSVDFRVANIGAIEERAEEKKSENRQHACVDLEEDSSREACAVGIIVDEIVGKLSFIFLV